MFKFLDGLMMNLLCLRSDIHAHLSSVLHALLSSVISNAYPPFFFFFFPFFLMLLVALCKDVHRGSKLIGWTDSQSASISGRFQAHTYARKEGFGKHGVSRVEGMWFHKSRQCCSVKFFVVNFNCRACACWSCTWNLECLVWWKAFWLCILAYSLV